jgi:NAD(P)-dependent dehydrogenase (short-subunit alcohol dehydrogenase family)
MLLSDKICIITGAASARGIGRATAGVFGHHGGRAVILDLDQKQAKLVAAEIGQGHRGFLLLTRRIA